jgi:arsenate reductase-like glutaredoxin family protein
VIQIFGTRKCADSRKAERFFRERGIPIQVIDLQKRGPSPGELRSVAARVGGFMRLIDRQGKRFTGRGLGTAYLTDPDIERLLLEDPLLLVTPIVRNGPLATLGVDESAWAAWLEKNR